MNRLLPGRSVRERYGVTDMTIWRWRRNPTLGFPKSIVINNRHYWRLEELEAWEATRAEESAA